MKTDVDFKTVEKKGVVSRIATAVTATGAAFAVIPAHAALDVTALTTEISGNSTSVQTIMLAILTIAALFVGFAFIKRSMR